MLRSSDFHVSCAQNLHLHINVNYQCPWCLWYMLTRISTKICTTKLLVGGNLCMSLHEISLILYFTHQGFMGGFKWAKSLCSEGRRGICVSVSLQCVIALCWAVSSPAGSGCMWDSMAAYQLTTHMSLWQGCSSLLTEMLWNAVYEKSKPKCFCNIMWGKTNVGVH